MTCPGCGASNASTQGFCHQCGAELNQQIAVRTEGPARTPEAKAPPRVGASEPGRAGPKPTPDLEHADELKSPAVAALLGLMPGVGQIYVGQPAKGVALLVGSLAAAVGLGVLTWGLYCVCVAPVLPFASAFDAAAIARRVNAGEMVRPWQFF